MWGWTGWGGRIPCWAVPVLSARGKFQTLGLVAIFTVGFVTVLALINVQASGDLV